MLCLITIGYGHHQCLDKDLQILLGALFFLGVIPELARRLLRAPQSSNYCDAICVEDVVTGAA